MLLAGCCLLVSCTKPDTGGNGSVPDAATARPLRPTLRTIGPRLLSNQTSQPLSVTGERLVPGLSLHLGAPVELDLPLTVLDATHAWARLPANASVGDQSEQSIEVTLSGGDGQASLRLINDTGFPDLTTLVVSPDGRFAFTSSGPTDTVYRIELGTRRVTPIRVGDGPSALAVWTDAAKHSFLVVVHQYQSEAWVIDVDDPTHVSRLPAPANASGVLVDHDVAYVAEQARDTVSALALADGRERWRTPVAPNPRELVLTPKGLLVGSVQTGELELLDPATGAPVTAFEPKPGTPIVGGGTAKYSAFIMNGKAVRRLTWSKALGRVFVSSIGPNIGPNPDKMEVSMNGGVGVVDPATGWVRHLGFGAGVTEGLALDDAKGLLYAADIGVGLVRVLDAKKLAASDASAGKALLQEVAMPPPADFPLIRPAADFTIKNRAGPSLHSGPRSLALSVDGKTLWVLDRFTGTLATVDVTRAAAGKAEWKDQVQVVDVLGQRTRRLGQVLYYADLGRTAMSCDACHLEGHGEGVLFEKTKPLRVYRSTTVRGSRETPPYFTPASTHSMGETAKVVGGRNRFHNPDPTNDEIDALALFASTIPTLPNPFVGPDGAPVELLRLPDGKEGHPRAGLALFEGKAGCATCHPAPQFTLDQDGATRARYLEVGTPHALPLREPMQNTLFAGFATPPLVGAWDTFPMLTTGLAGLTVEPDGRVRVDARFCLRVAVEKWAGASGHGRADQLSAQERDDLLAYVMSL